MDHTPRARLRSLSGPDPARRDRRMLAAVLALALVALLIVFAPIRATAATAATAAAPQGKPAKPACVADRPDRASAALTARLCQGRVEVANLRSETTQVFANADASFTAHVHRAPVRTRQGAAWVPVDLTLRRAADGSVAAAAHPYGLRLSGAAGPGARDLVSLTLDDGRIGVSWPDGLPAPVLDGTTATYPEIRPGVDMIVEATRTGFAQSYVIKHREAAARAAELTAELHGADSVFEPDAGGGIVIRDRANRVIGRAPAAVMSDSQVAPATGEHLRAVAVANTNRTSSAGRVRLLSPPDQRWLADSATRYPVTIAAQFNAGTLFDTYVKSGEDIDRSGANDLHVGLGGGKTARSFIQWNASEFVGAQIRGATVYLWNWYSASCTNSSWDIWTTAATDGSARWTAQPQWLFKEASSTSTRGFSTSCDDAWTPIDGQAFFQRAADSGNGGPFMGIRATSESDTNSWKQFRSRNAASTAQVPYAVVDYNRKPVVSAVSTAPPSPCVVGAGRPYVNTTTPTLRATVADADGSTVKTRFQWWAAGGPMIGEVYYPGGLLASGSTFSATVPAAAFANGGTYSWRALGDDGLIEGPWSAFCEFTVDNVAPAAAPSVISTDYPAGGWALGADRPGSFRFGGSNVADVAAYLYGLDQNPPTTAANPATLGGEATVSLTPPTDGPHTLYVRSQDRAGNLSPVSAYTFYVGTAAVTAPVDGDRTARDVLLSAVGPAGTSGITFQYRRSDLDSWVDVPTANVTRRSDGAAVTWPVPASGGSAPDLVWRVTDTVFDNAMLQIRAVLSSPAGTAAAAAVRLVVDRGAAKAGARNVGPGSLNLVTGDFRISGAEASPFGLSLSRTASSRDPALATLAGQVPIFGPQWAFGYLAGPGALNAAWLRRPTATTVEVYSGSGTVLRFAQTATGWRPEAGAERLSLALDGAADRFTLTDVISGEFAEFAKAAPAVSAYAVVSSGGQAQNSTFVYAHETVVGPDSITRTRLRKVIAPTTAATAAACAADPAVRGCRVLELVYATTTTATGAALGEVAGRVSQIRLWATAPEATAATAATLAQFAYDTAGNLREAWDPRVSPPLKTAYTYDAAGRVATLTPAGLLPWSFAYGTAGTAPTSGPGMLLSISRPTLQPGSATQVNGTARTSVVYDVPTTIGSGGPYNLGGPDVVVWGQQTAPATAVAIFPADSVPASSVGRGSLTSGAYGRADVHYLDRNGNEVNAAAPGGRITVTEYDGLGHAIRTLTAANRDLALGTAPDSAAQLALLGLLSAPTAQRAALLSSTSSYSADGMVARDNAGPVHAVTLAQPLAGSGGLPAQPAGSQVAARGHTVYTYDTGRPVDGSARTSHLVTRTMSGALVVGYAADGDVRLEDSEYDWVLGLKTRSIGDPTGLAVDEVTVYDAQGRVVEQRTPASSGNDAGTTISSYYTATGAAPCGGRPEWSDLPCRAGPKAAITGGGANPDELVTKTSTFTVFGDTATVSETANGITRVTTTTYDAAGRPTGTTVTGGVGDPVPATTQAYDPATGLSTTTTDASGAQIINGYDALGRLIAYTDAAGARTTYQYDALDRKILATDAAGTSTTYTYDTAAEPRGLLTASTDSVAGTFTAAYDANGVQVVQGLPGGVAAKTTIDPAGVPVAKAYSTVTGTPIAADSLRVDVDGNWLQHTGLSVQRYTMDALGRITQVDDVSENVCTRRWYGFGGSPGVNTNRTSKTTAVGAPGEPCPASGATTETHAYDSGDRIVDPGYGYDALGRTVAKPGGMTFGYYADDQIRQETNGDTRQTWTRDPSGRPASFTMQARDGIAWSTTVTKVNHFRGDGDRPDWIVEDTATGRITRNVAGTNGELSATTSATGELRLQLTDLHGDLAVVYDPVAVTADVRGTDEFGVPKPGLATDRYGWLGGHQRSQEALGGTMLMGQRVYDPASGRFLQTDPIVGGSANAYEYCSGNPTSCVDPDGLGVCWWIFCGWVFNDSNRYMRIGEIAGYQGGNCRIFDLWGWNTYRHARCSNTKGLPAGRNSRSRGSSIKDVDVATFTSTGWWFGWIWMSQNEYLKIRNGLTLSCWGGRWGRKPSCAF